MAKAKKASATIVKWKKKKWYNLVAPKLFNSQSLGQTLAVEDSQLKDRTVTANLMTLTRDIKKQNTNVTFKVDKVQGDTAFTSLLRYKVTAPSVRRMVRRNTEKVETSFVCYTADNIRVRVKMLALTRSSTTGSVLHALQKSLIQNATRAIKRLTYDQLTIEVVTSKFQRRMSSELRKIYPLRFCEVKCLEKEAEKRKVKAIEVSAEELEEEDKKAAERKAKIEAARKEKEQITQKPEVSIEEKKPEVQEAKPAEEAKEDVKTDNQG